MQSGFWIIQLVSPGQGILAKTVYHTECAVLAQHAVQGATAALTSTTFGAALLMGFCGYPYMRLYAHTQLYF